MILEELRLKIDKCNRDIVNCLKERFEITREIGKFKAENSLPPCDKAREVELINNMKKLAKESNLKLEMVEEIFKIIMKEVVEEHKIIRNGNKNN